jgi:hypothetical protein
LDDVLERERVERLPLSPSRCSRSNSASQASGESFGVGVVLDPLFEELARDLGLTARKAQRRIFEHRAKSGVRLCDLELPTARAVHWTRLAPDTVMSPGSTGSAALRRCEASSRAEAPRLVGRPQHWA